MMRILLRLSVSVALLAGIAWSAQPIWLQYQNWRDAQRLGQLAQQAEQAETPDAARAAVRLIREARGSTTATLARLAASPRPAVAAAAREAISAELSQASRQRPPSGEHLPSARRLALIARSLAENAPHYQGPTALWAQQVATKILAEAEFVRAGPWMQILADCESVVASVDGQRSAPGDVARAPTSGSASQGQPREVALQRAKSELPTASRAAASASPAPGGHSQDGARVATITPTPPAAALDPTTPTKRRSNLTWVRRSPDIEGLDLPTSDSSSLSVVEPWSVADSQSGDEQPAPLASAATHEIDDGARIIDVPSPEVLRHTSRRLAIMSSHQLLRELESLHGAAARPYESAAVRRELQQRGVSIPEIGVVSLRASDAPRRSADSPPLGIGATTGQLYQLTRHEDPAVRRRALSMLATSNDPQLPVIARERAVYDADSEVADLASRILEQGVRR